MNEFSLTQLKMIVERAVRPVQASWSRKRKMREELLAHVCGVFDEEAARLGDDRAAVERTAARFGNPAEVTSRLQESVPASDDISRFFNVDAPPGETIIQDALRLVRLTVAAALVIDLLGLALFAVGWWRATPGEVFICGLSFTFGSALYALALGGLASWIERRLHERQTNTSVADDQAAALGFWPELRGPTGRSRLWMALIPDVLVMVVLCLALVVWPPENWDIKAAVLAAVIAAGYVPLSTVIFAWWMANSAGVRRRCHDQWAQLAIEPSSCQPPICR